MKDKHYERPEAGIAREKIKEAVEYIFRQKPREDAEAGDMSRVIDIIQNQKQQSFSLPAGDSHRGRVSRLRTGLGGFINFVEGGAMISWYFIKFNGVILDKDQTEEFWNEYETIKEKYNN